MAKGQKIFKVIKVELKTGGVFNIVEPIEGVETVKEITFNRADKAYNGGLQMPGASYTIHLSNEERILVPFENVSFISGIWVATKNGDNGLPELPED